MSKRLDRYLKYPVRTCRYLNHCSFCDQDITAGQTYYDGGYGSRAHVICVAAELKNQTENAKETKHG